MALSPEELQLIEEGIELAVSAVLAAVQAAGHKEPIDWNSVRITQTPEMALDKAKAKGAEAQPPQGTRE